MDKEKRNTVVDLIAGSLTYIISKAIEAGQDVRFVQGSAPGDALMPANGVTRYLVEVAGGLTDFFTSKAERTDFRMFTSKEGIEFRIQAEDTGAEDIDPGELDAMMAEAWNKAVVELDKKLVTEKKHHLILPPFIP